MSTFEQIALIGPTASGKTALAIEYAQKHPANILSLDSLALYKEIDIVSAKPTVEARQGIPHFGLDVISPDEAFDVTLFIELYHEAKTKSQNEGKQLVIVGGTSFYLKTLIDGISPLPSISESTQERTARQLQTSVTEAHRFLHERDPNYMQKIEMTDRYRIEKMLNLYFETGLTPTEYFESHPPRPIITEALPIYEIHVERELLRQRIRTRTETMMTMGLIEEVAALEQKYTRRPNCMKAIGIRETLDYFDGIYTQQELIEKITINTARLAKRQRTFNRSQFQEKVSLPLDELRALLLDD